MQKNTITELTLCAVLLVIATGMVSVRYFARYEGAQNIRIAAVEERAKVQQEGINKAQTEIAALLDANKTVAETLKQEAIKRVAAEQAAANAQAQINQLKNAADLSGLISSWRPRVAYIKCQWQLSPTSIGTKSGTAVLVGGAAGKTIELTTNKHVVTYQDKIADSCSVRFPGQADEPIVASSDITIAAGDLDWAKMKLTSPSNPIKTLAATTVTTCSATPSIGAQIVILGYPNIGARDDITATEGIISGFDSEYYITSAKVERGNSGGAAILVDKNCYLGIPTFVDAGQIESLARILDQRLIGN